MDDLEPKGTSANTITLGEDLSTLSLDDLDERVELLMAEIERLKQEKVRKAASLDAANSFFKS